MKKRLLAILALLVALTLVVLTGCEKKVERKGNDDKTTKAETTEEVKDDNEGEEDTTEDGDAVGEETPEAGKDKPSKPESGDKDKESVELFEDPNKEENVAQDYVDDIVESGDDVKSDEEIFKSGEFVASFRDVSSDGTTTYMKMAMKGDDIAVYVDSPEENMGIIIVGDVLYMILVDEEAYLPVPKELLGDSLDDLMSGFDDVMASDDTKEEPVKTYPETINGVEYMVAEYEDGRKAYYIGERCIMRQTTEGSMMYIDELSGNVPASEFEVPAGYRQVTITEFQELTQ